MGEKLSRVQSADGMCSVKWGNKDIRKAALDAGGGRDVARRTGKRERAESRAEQVGG